MLTKTTLTLVCVAAAVTGCSRDYTPPPQASGEEIFQSACAECHQADKQGALFSLSKKNANRTYIIHKVKSGSISMPAFVKLKTADLDKLGDYVLQNIQIEQ